MNTVFVSWKFLLFGLISSERGSGARRMFPISTRWATRLQNYAIPGSCKPGK